MPLIRKLTSRMMARSTKECTAGLEANEAAPWRASTIEARDDISNEVVARLRAEYDEREFGQSAESTEGAMTMAAPQYQQLLQQDADVNAK